MIARCKRLAGDGFGDVEFGGVAVMEEAANGEEFGVEDGGTGGSADEIVREQRELDVEERTFADAAYDGRHAVTGAGVVARLRAIFLVHDDGRISDGGRERGELVVHGKIAQNFRDFTDAGNFLQAERNAFKVTVAHGNAIAVRADAEARVDESRTIPSAQQFLRLGFHFFFFAPYEGHHLAPKFDPRT